MQGQSVGNRYIYAAGIAVAGLCAASLQAGDTVIYAPPAPWVVPADFPAALAKDETLVLIDQQVRMEGGTVTAFSDVAYRIESPEALTKGGTLQLAWLPDKGDLTVHRIELYRDRKRALADFDKAIALEPSAESFTDRANLRKELGDLPGALADAREAYRLEATVDYARGAADILAQQGKAGEALALLDPFDLSGDERIELIIARADIMGEGGRAGDGWALLEEAAGERPGDARVLNAQCWFMGNWSFRLESAGELCDRAVKVGSYGSGVLDSRALVHYRLGQRTEALNDLQAALGATPDQSTSLYLRGLMAMQDGKRAEGQRDIAAAARLYAGIEAYFERFGVKRVQ